MPQNRKIFLRNLPTIRQGKTTLLSVTQVEWMSPDLSQISGHLSADLLFHFDVPRLSISIRGMPLPKRKVALGTILEKSRLKVISLGFWIYTSCIDPIP